MAALLAGGGAFYHFVFARPGIEAALLQMQTSPVQRRAAIGDCMQAAEMVFAVHWAAACMAEAGQTPGNPDGNAECDLSDSQAAVVNAWLDEAEKACVTEARAGPAP